MWKVAGTAYRQRSRDAGFRLSDADNELDDLATSLVNEGVPRAPTPGRRRPRAHRPLLRAARGPRRQPGPAGRHDGRAASPGRAPAPRPTQGRRPGDAGPEAAWAPPVPPPDRQLPSRADRRRVLRSLPVRRRTTRRECAVAVNKLVTSSDLIDEHFEEVRGFERARRRAHRRPPAPAGRELRHAVRPRGHPRARRRARRRRRRHVRGRVAAPAVRRRATSTGARASWPTCWSR